MNHMIHSSHVIQNTQCPYLNSHALIMQFALHGIHSLNNVSSCSKFWLNMQTSTYSQIHLRSKFRVTKHLFVVSQCTKEGLRFGHQHQIQVVVTCKRQDFVNKNSKWSCGYAITASTWMPIATSLKHLQLHTELMKSMACETNLPTKIPCCDNKFDLCDPHPQRASPPTPILQVALGPTRCEKRCVGLAWTRCPGSQCTAVILTQANSFNHKIKKSATCKHNHVRMIMFTHKTTPRILSSYQLRKLRSCRVIIETSTHRILLKLSSVEHYAANQRNTKIVTRGNKSQARPSPGRTV